MADTIIAFRGAYRFLSNFYHAAVVYEGVRYPSVEHAFQAAKINPTDPRLDQRRRAIQAATSGLAKRIGRHVPLRPEWEVIKQSVMFQLLQQKFAPGSPLANQLLATGDAELIEGNDWGDTYWGVYNGVGENHLGQLLMQVRKDLRG